VKYRYLALTLGIVITSLVFVVSSCKKINAVTELGGGLIPAVDNITTFDTTLTVEAYNDLFTDANDTLGLLASDEHYLGIIDNANKDPLFGTTDARLFLELKPVFPYSLPNTKDSLHLDSAVLVLDYNRTYGDSTIPQTVNVYEMDLSNDFRSDSIYNIRVSNNFTYSNLLGSRTFAPTSLNDSVAAFQDTTKNQLRIRLADAFGRRLLDYDSISTSPLGAYTSDSIFKTNFFKGFALQATSGKAVMGFNLAGANTKLALYFRYDKIPVMDSAVVVYFNFTSQSAYANYVQRNYGGSQLATYQGGTSPDPLVFLQNTPGSFAMLKVPDLANLGNRVVHRAELIVEQVHDPSDDIFTVPDYLYLDAYDSLIAKYRTIPFDLTADANGLPNYSTFGMAPVNEIDGSGNTVKAWKLNITRYVQHVLTHTEPLYNMRLYSPFLVRDIYRASPLAADGPIKFIINSTIVRGRVRVAGNTGHADTNPQRMRLHIIYSKL
jgi:Domain of unknown function (DUF4270)